MSQSSDASVERALTVRVTPEDADSFRAFLTGVGEVAGQRVYPQRVLEAYIHDICTADPDEAKARVRELLTRRGVYRTPCGPSRLQRSSTRGGDGRGPGGGKPDLRNSSNPKPAVL